MRHKFIAFFFGVVLAATISSLEVSWGYPGQIEDTLENCVGFVCTPVEECFGRHCWLTGCFRDKPGGRIIQCNYECADGVCVIATG